MKTTYTYLTCVTLAAMMGGWNVAGWTQPDLQHGLATAPRGETELHIQSVLDVELARPLVAAFERAHPGVRVHFESKNSNDLYQDFVADVASGRQQPDLLTSSAMDLQAKLANDGYARAHELANADRLPAGTVWRNEAFAFTLEPLVIVYNSNLVPPNVVPVSRYRLLEILTRSPHLYFGRIGIYDPTVSAIGYLTFTQDAEQSPIFWELIQEFGAVGTKLYAQARDILRAVTSGELLLGYNVPGSYAMAWAETNPSVEVVLPADYTLAISRIALIPKGARQAELAGEFLEFLLSSEGQGLLPSNSRLLPASIEAGSVFGDALQSLAESGQLRPVRMGPGLLVYVDELKRQNFLRRWRTALAARRPALP